MTTKKRRGPVVALSIPLLMGLCFTVLPAAAADVSSATDLEARLASDQARAERLQQLAAAEQARLSEIQVADLFGPTDEEKAAAAAAAEREQTQDNNIAALSQRESELEDSLRKLTGEIELINHRLDEIDQHIERVKKEFDYKLCTLSAQQLGAGAAPGTPDSTAGGTLPCNPAAAASTPSVQNTPSSAEQAPLPSAEQAPPTGQAPGTGAIHLTPPPGVLGTLPQGQANAVVPPPAQAAPSGPELQTPTVDTHAQFETAMNMLAKSQYDEASGAFRTFVDANPNDPLAPQALYWLGDIAYVQKDYPSAARAFVEELKKYPTSPRAPESMLKLGQSLLAMNQKQEGCTTLRALVEKYPQASRKVLNEAEALRRSGGCRR